MTPPKVICRKVSLELLRPGPPHNHLLSPLTDYLGIANQASAAVINIPYEHGEFMRRLSDLHYPFSRWPKAMNEAQQRFFHEQRIENEKERKSTLQELSSSLTKALCQVPGLASQLSRRGCNANELVHLEIVVSAGELAMLPFEILGNIEQGPVEPGRYLLLSGAPAVCLTRRVRNITGDCCHWTRQPRILFVPASPGKRRIPRDEHQAALQKALAPWVIFDPAKEDAFYSELDKHLTILEEPTIAKIANACAQEQYTHVHILAHGEPLPAAPGGGFGVALHKDQNPSESHIVTGDQLASALQREIGRSGPTVVSLAMCDSAAVADVVYTGASFAHELHRSGIPFVVASQFPLAFNGSTLMTEMLYERLLLGHDPRSVLVDIRTRLHALYATDSHDWASLVVYAALPSDIDLQIEQLQYDQSKRALYAARIHVFDLLKRSSSASVSDASSRALPAEERALDMVRNAERDVPDHGRFRSEGLGLRAAAKKSLAEVMFHRGKLPTSPDSNAQLKKSSDYLREALLLYEQATRESLTHRPKETMQQAALHWTLGQVTSLEMVLRGAFDEGRWWAAHLSADADARGSDEREVRVWGHGTLLELALLRAWRDAPAADATFAQFELALHAFLSEARPGDFAIVSLDRQLTRYLDWWWTTTFDGTLGDVTRREPSPGLRQAVERARTLLQQQLTTSDAPG